MNRNCPICSSPDKEHLYRQDFHNKAVSLMKTYDVEVCTNCGFVYADNIPPQKDFDRYYEVMSKYEYNHKEGVVSEDNLRHFSKIVDFLAPLLTDKSSIILDVGCSTGGLLSIFKSKGYSNIIGIDPSASCARSAKELYGIDVRVNNINNFKSAGKFDLIVLSAVLEHLSDFGGSMRKIRSLLKDDGLLFIEVPDAERFAEFIAAPFQQFSVEHINYFSRYSMRNFLSVFSFSPVKVVQSASKLNLATDPDLFVLSAKTKITGPKIMKDKVSEVKVREYIAESVRIDARIKELINKKLSGTDKMIVWGVGTHTQRLLGSGLDPKRILYFVDSNSRYTGKMLGGREIKSPEKINEKNVPILISTYSYQDEIAGEIKNKFKLKNEIIRIY